MTEERFVATYLIETSHSPDQAAEVMAGEQSSGTFVRVPGETEELREIHAGRVERVTLLDTADTPSLPGSRPPEGWQGSPRYRRAEIEISFPAINVGSSLSQLMTTVAGNLFELAPLSGLRLIDVTIPESFTDNYPGPQFGIEGTRRLAGVQDRPLFGTIIKPSVGLSPQQTAGLVETLVRAGVDFIKDDELISNPAYSPLEERVAAVMPVINAHAERTGKKVMYAFNISDDLDQMLRHHDSVLKAGGTCVMVNMISVGLAGVIQLCRYSQMPVHGHRNGWGGLSRHPLLGMDYRAFQKFWRVAGVDHLHVNGLHNKFVEPDESVIASARECLTPLLGGYTVMPVFSSGQTAAQVPGTYAALNSKDFLFLAGGGIMAHPGGPAGGVASLREAWEATASGTDLKEYAAGHAALGQALEKYGTV
jgi:ribulose-bisphosphate carboxylase large chain